MDKLSKAAIIFSPLNIGTSPKFEKIKTLLNYSIIYNISFLQTSKEPGLVTSPGKGPIKSKSMKPLTFYKRFSRF